SVPAAYSIARLTGRWGGRLAMTVFIFYLVPPTLLFLPLSRIVADLGLQDTIWSLVVVYPTLTAPFSTWLLVGFFRSIPRDIEEQAMVDGYSRAREYPSTIACSSMSRGIERKNPTRSQVENGAVSVG